MSLRKFVLCSVILVILFLIIPLIKTRELVGVSYPSSGWTVGYIKIKKSNNFTKDIKQKIISGDIDLISNTSTKFGVNIDFNADPFLFEYEGCIYLFVETKPFHENAFISVYKWNSDSFLYQGVALNEQFHLSYPKVYNIKNQPILIPETQGSGFSMVYKTDSFPFNWKPTDTLSLSPIKDPTLVFQTRSTGQLYYAVKSNLYKRDFKLKSNGKFQLTKEKFIRTGKNSRPGGGPVYWDSDTFLCLQNNAKGYGSGLDLYSLKKDEIAAFLRPSSVIEEFSAGMHHFSTFDFGDSILCVFDGNKRVSNKIKLNFKQLLKSTYLEIWQFWFPNIEPFYPFNY